MNTSELLELENIEIERQREHDRDVARFYMLAERGRILRSIFGYHNVFTDENRVKNASALKELKAVENEFLDLKEKLCGYR